MKFYIDTLGCPKNITDSEGAAGLLEQAGHEFVGEPEAADVLIINTCGFIQDAKEESIDRILDMVPLKEMGKRLVVTGCLSQRYKDQLAILLPEADIILGVDEYHRLPLLLKEHKLGSRVTGFDLDDNTYREVGIRKNLSKPYSNYLKIAEGCDNVCAYCIIPSIRGGYRSRSKEEILQEARELSRNGCKELILIAQDVTAYGIDRYGRYELPALLEELCKMQEIHWVRLMYCYEDRITDELIETIKKQPKICPYLDVPIQHASDQVLSSMNRRSTKASIENTINRLRKAIPEIHIRTTLITGFPGETKEDYETLYAFVEQMKFERLGIFAYSKEEGTAAALRKDQIPKQTKLKRRDRLMELQRQLSYEHNQTQIGKVIEVLVEEIGEEYIIGRTAYDAPDIDNNVLFTSEYPVSPGEFVSVFVTDAFDYDLVGRQIQIKE